MRDPSSIVERAEAATRVGLAMIDIMRRPDVSEEARQASRTELLAIVDEFASVMMVALASDMKAAFDAEC